MTAELNEHVRKIRSLSPQLNKATDEAAAAVARVEKLLNDECSVGVEAFVGFYDSDTVRRFLGYARCDGKFRIVVDEQEAALDDEGNPLRDYAGDREWKPETRQPWGSVPRGVKLSAIKQLPALLSAVVQEVESIVKSASEAIEAVRQIEDAVAGGDSPKADRTVTVPIERAESFAHTRPKK